LAVIEDQLKACPLFAGFTPTGLKIFAQIARIREVPEGMSVFLAGTTGDSLVIVDSGEVEIFLDSGKTLCTLGPGAHFGELAAIRPSKRAVSARAKSAARLIEIRRADFGDLLKTKPQACFKLMLSIFGVVAERLEAVRGDLTRLA
jgi:CRP-like cAMP-binding protein